MKFNDLNRIIPYVTGGKEKILRMHPYNAITLRLPGRHANETTPVGGDFVVCVDDDNMIWTEHQFTHTDIFRDLQYRFNAGPSGDADFILRRYADIVADGDDPEKMSPGDDYTAIDGCMHPKTFFYAIQCLAIAEHRRYARFENRFGGRYLPFRFGAGIVEGLWTAQDAIDKQKMGRPGVEWLEKDFGLPALTKELMT